MSQSKIVSFILILLSLLYVLIKIHAIELKMKHNLPLRSRYLVTVIHDLWYNCSLFTAINIVNFMI